MNEESLKLIITNQSNNDRIIRAVIAVVLIGTYFAMDFSINAIIANLILMIAAVLLFNAISGNCYIYRIFGINTCKIPESGE